MDSWSDQTSCVPFANEPTSSLQKVRAITTPHPTHPKYVSVWGQACARVPPTLATSTCLKWSIRVPQPPVSSKKTRRCSCDHPEQRTISISIFCFQYQMFNSIFLPKNLFARLFLRNGMSEVDRKDAASNATASASAGGSASVGSGLGVSSGKVASPLSRF